MNGLECVTVPDVHLDFLQGKHPEPIGILLEEIRKPLVYAKKHAIPYVFFLGDLGNSPSMTHAAQQGLFGLLDEFDGCFEMHIIAGNHDLQSEGVTSLSVLQTIEHKYKSVYVYLKPEQVELDGVVVNFLPYPYSEPIIAPGDRPTLNVGHFTPLGGKADNGRVMTKGVAIQSNGDQFLLGHMHAKQRTADYYCPGTLYPVKFGETMERSFAHLSYRESADGQKVQRKIREIPVEPRLRYERVLIETEHDFQTLEANPDVLYEVEIAAGVHVPFAMLNDINIVRKKASKSELARQAERAGHNDTEIPDVEEKTLLYDFLVSQRVSGDLLDSIINLDNVLRQEVQSKRDSRNAMANRESF